MERNRSRLDITHDMLAAIAAKQGEIKPTHLMYKSNLSYTQMQGYLKELMENNLVRKEKKKDREVIVITDQGYELLKRIEDMRSFHRGFAL